MSKKLLIIDDEENMLHMLSSLTSKAGYSVSIANNGETAVKALAKGQFDIVLCDLKMPHVDGMEVLKAIKIQDEDTAVIMMSAYGTIDTAVEAMKNGAYDFITKPFKKDEVLLALEKAAETQQLRRENLMLKRKVKNLEGSWGFGAMVGENPGMLKLFGFAEKVAQHNSTVLITGESGTGKELLAKGIYLSGNRKNKPFIAVNCGSIPANLLESEFFGYCRGAFTGADSDRKGLFEEADGGTLFLDEIGELPLDLQIKLLRVLQENEIRPLGSARNVMIDVRVIAATAKDLKDEVERGLFRQDLFFRLNVIQLKIPPLRQRRDDIPLLCQHLLRKLNDKLQLNVTSIRSSAMAALLKYSWPGNVRELENVLEGSCIFAETDALDVKNLPKSIIGVEQVTQFDQLFTSLSMKKGKAVMERNLIIRALEEAKGNKSKAAELLEVSYPSLLAKIKEYRIMSLK